MELAVEKIFPIASVAFGRPAGGTQQIALGRSNFL
jgi:hypothetical protein